jgi:hypothetical protein
MWSILKKSKYAKTLDNCTAYAFNQAIRESDYSGLLVSGKFNESKAIEAWEEILSEYFKVFGIPKGYKNYLQKRFQALSYYDKAYNKGRKAYLIQARIAEKQALDMLGVGASASIGELAVRASKYMGFKVDPKVESVRYFYGIIEEMNKEYGK